MSAEAKEAASGGVAEVQLSLVQKGRALVGALQPAYWQALIVVSLLYFARFDASFITLRARTVRPSHFPLDPVESSQPPQWHFTYHLTLLAELHMHWYPFAD